MSVVHYKFKNNLEYETVSFDGLSISLGDLKRAVMAQNKTKSGEFDLEIKNAQTKEVYKDDSTQIQKNASVVIRRIPLGPKGKALTAAERPESPGSLTTKPSEGQAENEAPPVIPLSKLNKVADLATANASEDDKIAAMMNQAGEDWDPSLYARAKGRYSNVAPRVPPPAHYLCFRCRKPGHWIQSCPTNGDPNYDMKVRRTTGIPKSFLRLADNPTQKGALLIAETGQYAVPIVDHHAYEQAATKKRSKDVSGGGVEMERAIPREYLCPICKKVMTNAVVVPCCGESFCDHCIVSYLLEKEHVCPSCGKDNVSPDSIIINKLLRQAIIKFRSSNQEGSFSATSSPSALRDEDTARQGRTTPIPVSLPVSTSVVTTAPVAVTEKAPDPVVTTSAESSQAKSRESSPSIAPQVTTSPTHTPSTQSAPSGSQAQDTNSVAGASHDPVSDTRFQRVPPNDQQVSEGYAQPLRLPAHGLGSLGPIHRPSYVVASSALAHHHHAMVHATIPSLGIPAYGHLPHPALIPGPPALPFADLDPDLGLMMNEEEFYRAKLKLAERGRKKRRGEDDIKRKRKKDRSRSRRRERLVSPSSRRTLPDDDFAFELANYQAVQRDRLRRRSRSRSWTPSGSSSLSNSSWSHSWSRSKSPSRSYSRSKSRTPVNWDRSRSPTPPVEKSTKPVRLEGEDKKRKKPGRDLVRKRSKIDPKDAVSKATEKLEARLGSSDDVKSQVLSKKGKDAKTPTMKKESRKKDSDRKDTSAKKQSTKASETVVGKTATGRGKTKEVIRKDIRNSRDGSPVVKTRADVKMKASSRGGSPVERKTAKTQEKKKKVSTSKDSSVATAVKKTTTDIKKKKETTSSNAIPARTATAGSKRKQKDTRESELVVSKDTIPRDKKRTSSKRETVRCEGSSEIKQTSVREKSSVRRDSNSEKQIKKKSRLEVNVLHSEKRDKAIERKKSGEKQKKDSVSGRTDKQASLEEDVSKAAKVKKREGKKKKQRKSVSEDIESSENREERRMSRKRPKEIKEDVGEDVEIKSPKKRKKKRDSVNEEPAKDTKHKKRKHKKKHRKHKHRKKTKHKEKKKKTTAGKEEEEKNDSEAASSLDFENELGDGIEEGDKGVVVDNEEHSGESSKSEPGLSEESEDSGEKGVESGSEYENDVEEVKNEDNESGDEGSSDGDKGMYSDGEGEDDGVDVEKEDEKMEEEQEEDDEEVEEEEVEDEQSGEEEEIEQPSEEENESDVEVEQDNEELEEEAQNSEVGESSEVDEMEEEEKEEEVEEEKEHEDNEDEESQENEEVMEELDESEENAEEEGKDNVDESGDEQELIHGDGQGEDTAGDEALLGSDADEEECSENEEDIEDLLGEDEAVDGESETGNENPEQDLSVSDVPEENLNESVDSSKEIQDLAEADLPNDDSQNVNETELFLPTADDTLQMVPESSKQTEVTDENQIVCQNVTSEDVPEDKVNPLSEPYQEKPFSDASHEPLETVKRRPQLEFQRRNGIGETIDTRPKSIQFENFRRFDSGLGTLSSLDSTPELDDPNYTDFDAPPMFIDDRRTSNDILQALINDETGEDF